MLTTHNFALWPWTIIRQITEKFKKVLWSGFKATLTHLVIALWESRGIITPLFFVLFCLVLFCSVLFCFVFLLLLVLLVLLLFLSDSDCLQLSTPLVLSQRLNVKITMATIVLRWRRGQVNTGWVCKTLTSIAIALETRFNTVTYGKHSLRYLGPVLCSKLDTKIKGGET